jgi:hypothetical protein
MSWKRKLVKESLWLICTVAGAFILKLAVSEFFKSGAWPKSIFWGLIIMVYLSRLVTWVQKELRKEEERRSQ